MTSKPGRGTTFRLSVPVDRVDAPPQTERAGTRARPTRALSILCAEDNPYGRVVMNTILTELGHRVDFVASGEAAVEAAARGGYDAVLMDITLAGFDGIEATRRIRALPGQSGPSAGDRHFRPHRNRRRGRRARRRHELLFHQAGRPRQTGTDAGGAERLARLRHNARRTIDACSTCCEGARPTSQTTPAAKARTQMRDR